MLEDCLYPRGYRSGVGTGLSLHAGMIRLRLRTVLGPVGGLYLLAVGGTGSPRARLAPLPPEGPPPPPPLLSREVSPPIFLVSSTL